MSIKTLATINRDLFVEPGDFIRVTYQHRKDNKEILLEVEIKKEFRISTIKVIEFENEFGLERGLAAILGE